ncbi:MAG TPA: InlB B-repeat-containing protein, partial [Methanocorpusculum sp.]|nr:InlB B-repeat-containing protein [Methanocorpusculum sp.]
YTFGGWYKDSACTQEWSSSDSIPGDMTLYAKWTTNSASQTTTTAATAQQTTKATPAATQSQTAAATTAAPVTTTAAGVSPSLTQAPAPVFGMLLGLIAVGVLLRRKN